MKKMKELGFTPAFKMLLVAVARFTFILKE